MVKRKTTWKTRFTKGGKFTIGRNFIGESGIFTLYPKTDKAKVPSFKTKIAAEQKLKEYQKYYGGANKWKVVPISEKLRIPRRW